MPKLASEITGIDKSEVMYQSLKNPSMTALSKCPIPNDDKVITRNGILWILGTDRHTNPTIAANAPPKNAKMKESSRPEHVA